MPSLLIVANVPSMLREFFLPYVTHLTHQGWRVDGMVSTATTEADLGDELEAFGQIHHVAWSRNPFDLRNFTEAPKAVRDIVATHQYDLVHVHSPVAAFVTRYALRNANPAPAIIYTVHGFHFHRGGNVLKNRLYLTLEKIAGPWTDFMLVMNCEDEAAARKHRIVPADRLAYVPGVGVDVSGYDPERIPDAAVQAVRQEFALGPTDPLLLMIAEFNPGKRHRDALAALAQLPRRDVKLALAGVGPLEPATRALASNLGLADRVLFLGYRRDVPVLLKAATALVLPSEREGLPRAVLEALSMGTPVISTAIRGVEDLLADDRGVMVPVGGVASLRDAIGAVLDDPAAARSRAVRGQAFAKAFDLENVLRFHDELYTRALRE